MGKIVGKAQYRDILLGAGLLWATLALILWPDQAMEAMRDGLKLCGNVILPSLFPFFVLSSLVVELGMSRYLGKLLEPVMAPLFRVNGNCAAALALGFVGGYPVGARTAIELYEQDQCSRTEAERMLAFCNNSGPAFILGVVGAGVFGSGTVGLLLYLAHLLSSLLVGVLFRFYRPGDGPQTRRSGGPQFQTASFPKAFTQSVLGAMQSTLNICAFILFFTVFLRILAQAGVLTGAARLLSALLAPLGLDQTWAERLLTGLVEVSSGVSSLTDGTLPGRLSMAAFMLGWAGVSIHCQVLAFLGDSGLSVKTYVAGKLLHGGISALLTNLLFRLFPFSSPASVYLAEQAQAISQLDFDKALTLSAVSAWAMWLIFLALTVYAVQKNSGKDRPNVV